ncbi:MAG: hypothetical protein A3C36_02315 [Omnitrophica WOR_2 bacterium RIFCSPHIGHO2_02_FULL_52_10]|nr:MAG: hypothetical protein A3C36_02315 [Omnitrophica WOR_2 bacterium RIFCSPHIGHO2_02_FULL_52_10]
MPRILVIDDNDAFKEMICEILKNEGYKVLSASNGKEGVKLCRAQPVDLIVTDLLMPDMDGIETIREMKTASPDSKVIVVSGGGTAGTAQDYLEAVSVMCDIKYTFSKPFDMDQFLQAVKELVG